MIRDLVLNQTPDQQGNADVLVIGGGIAGLLVATRLARAGRKVIVAESGGLAQIGETHPLNEVEQLGDIYSGAEHGRFRCLGGTSTRWGGAMLPFQPIDLAEHGSAWSSTGWPIPLNTLTDHQGEIELLFGLKSGPYDFPEIMPGLDGGPGLSLARLAKWPAFKLRNLASLLREDIESGKGPEIWLNATATHFAFEPSGLLAKVEMRSHNGRTLSVAATQTVVAAGAIESTRLLLLADHQNGDRIFAPDGVLGRYFYDHLSVATGKLVDPRRKELNRLVGFRFEGTTMRNLRFEPTAYSRAELTLPAAFVHIAFATDNPGGFDALRDVYRKIQRREKPSVRDIVKLSFALPWLSRAAWWRLVEKRLLFPDNADLEIHVVIEQEPNVGNRISLSSRRVDMHGCPIASVDWRVNQSDAGNLVATTKAFLDAWNTGPLADLAQAQLNLPQDPRNALAQGGGIYHPGGSVRMGVDASGGVVDGELRVFRVPNLSVVSTAAFPRGGGANPTMMLMMAAMRAADRIARNW